MSLKPWDEGYVPPDVEPSHQSDHAHKGGKATRKKYQEAGVKQGAGRTLPEQSEYSQKLEARTAETMPLKTQMFYDKFLSEYMHDFCALKAWARAGGPDGSPNRAYEILRTGYAQQKLRALLDQIDEENLLSNKDIIMGIKKEACNFAENGSPTARVNAWKLLAQLRGMLVKKSEKKVHHSGGVMLIPAQAKDVTTWEHDAAESQTKLKEDVRK